MENASLLRQELDSIRVCLQDSMIEKIELQNKIKDYQVSDDGTGSFSRLFAPSGL